MRYRSWRPYLIFGFLLAVFSIANGFSSTIIDPHMATVDDARIYVSICGNLDPIEDLDCRVLKKEIEDLATTMLSEGEIPIAEASDRLIIIFVKYKKKRICDRGIWVSATTSVELGESVRSASEKQNQGGVLRATTWSKVEVTLVEEQRFRDEILENVRSSLDRLCEAVVDSRRRYGDR